MTNFEYYTTAENGSEEFTEAVKKLAYYKDHRNIINCEDILNFLKETHKPMLDDVEREYLSHIIKPFKQEVKSISKENWRGVSEFIQITISHEEDPWSPLHNIYEPIVLPNFKKGTMYRGMELNKEYTLEELGL